MVEDILCIIGMIVAFPISWALIKPVPTLLIYGALSVVTAFQFLGIS